MAGGNGGVTPRIARLFMMGWMKGEVMEKIDKIIKVYAEGAKKHERLGKFIERIGLEEFKASLRNSFLSLVHKNITDPRCCI